MGRRGFGGGKNLNESPLIQTQLDRFRKRYKFSYNKIYESSFGERLLQNFSNFNNFDLNVIVFNFIDMLSHARTESKMIRELASSNAAYRSLTESWFRHSSASDLLRRIAESGARVVLTTDHGTIRVDNPIKVVGDKATNTNLRYKLGKTSATTSGKFMKSSNRNASGCRLPTFPQNTSSPQTAISLRIQTTSTIMCSTTRIRSNTAAYRWKRCSCR